MVILTFSQKLFNHFYSKQPQTIKSNCTLRTRALSSYLRATSDLTTLSAIKLHSATAETLYPVKLLVIWFVQAAHSKQVNPKDEHTPARMCAFQPWLFSAEFT